MDEDDLDAELLAVTDVKKGASSSVGAASDSENGEFDGIAESEDDDVKSDGDDDDDDNDSFDLDDDYRDDDYGARPKKRSRTSKSKSQPKSKKVGSSRAKSGDGRKPSSKSAKGGKSARATDRDSDTEVFEYKYDQDGYGDPADRDELAKMSEIQRETILADRKDERNKQFVLWEKKRELAARKASSFTDGAANRGRSSTRAKSSSKADALEALSQDIRKKSAAPIDMDVVDADSEGEREPKRDREKKLEKIKEEDTKPEAPLRDDDGPELSYSDLVTKSRDGNGSVTTPLFLRRDTLIHLSQQPYFARVIEGLFCRVKVGDARDSYVFCRITGVKKGRVYDLQLDKTVRTNLQLVLQSGATRKPFPICIMSSSHPAEREFNTYRNRAVEGGIEIPRREEVERLRKRAYATIVEGKVTATDAETRQHRENTETVYPRRVNWTQKRTETQTNLNIKQQELSEAKARGLTSRVAKFEKEVEELEERLRDIRENESLYGQKIAKTNTQTFQNIAKRNMLLNSKNDKLAQGQKILNTNVATLDPFSRVETTGQSYFSIKQKGEEEGGGANGTGAETPNVHDWRTYLLSYEGKAPRSHISEDALEAGFGAGLQGLDAFTDEAYLDPVVKKPASLVPPGLDAVYELAGRQEEELPAGAKTIGFDDWMKQRGTM